MNDLPEGATSIPGHIVVKFHPSVTQEEAIVLVNDYGLSTDNSLDLLGAFIVCTNPGDEEEWVRWFTKGPLGDIVEYAEWEGVVRVHVDGSAATVP